MVIFDRFWTFFTPPGRNWADFIKMNKIGHFWPILGIFRGCKSTKIVDFGRFIPPKNAQKTVQIDQKSLILVDLDPLKTRIK